MTQFGKHKYTLCICIYTNTYYVQLFEEYIFIMSQYKIPDTTRIAHPRSRKEAVICFVINEPLVPTDAAVKSQVLCCQIKQFLSHREGIYQKHLQPNTLGVVASVLLLRQRNGFMLKASVILSFLPSNIDSKLCVTTFVSFHLFVSFPRPKTSEIKNRKSNAIHLSGRRDKEKEAKVLYFT